MFSILAPLIISLPLFAQSAEQSVNVDKPVNAEQSVNADKPIQQNSSEKLIDRIEAVVDSAPILFSVIDQKIKTGPLISVSDYPSTEESSQFEKALNDAINFELIMMHARDMEISVNDSEVEAEVDRFLQSRGTDRASLMQFLDSRGQSYEDYINDFRDQMVLRRFQGRVISPLVKITDKDVETYFIQKQGGTSDLVEVTLRQLLIRLDPAAPKQTRSAKEELARQVYQRLKDGMSFEEAVKIYSDDTAGRESGGLMAPIALKDLTGEIRTEVEGLQKGAYTPPVRTGLGMHIFYLEDKQFSGSQEFLQKKRQLEYELRSIELSNQTKKWLAEQRQKVKIKILN